MKTVKYYLENAERDEILDNLAYDLLRDPLPLLEAGKMSVNEIQESYKIRMNGFIDQLLSVEVRPSDHMVLYMCDTASYDGGGSEKDKEICLVDLDRLREDIYAVEYGFEMSPLEETLGYLVADNKLTQDYLTELLAQYLKEVSFFGLEMGQRAKKLSRVHEELRKSIESLQEGQGIPANEMIDEIEEKLGFPADEKDEIRDELKRKAIEAEMEFGRYCHWRERKIILENIGFEVPEYSISDALEGVYTIHYCEMPLRDSARVWIGKNRSKYVDFHGMIPERSIINWFEKYGSSVSEDWQYYYPQWLRRIYINRIKDRGYNQETAEKIIQYLPQTDSESYSSNVSQMIRLFKFGNPPVTSDCCDPVKKKVADNEPDFWDTKPYSPRAERARHQGYIEGLAESFRELSEEKQTSAKMLVEQSGICEETKKEVLAFLENENV